MKKALGKGLNALLPSSPVGGETVVVELDIGKVEPNPEQPRKNFDVEAIGQLAESIAAVGVVQPIIVTDEGTYYRIVAGERRWRAARIAGLKEIPAIVRDLSGERRVETALIENLQRQDLNPIEEAGGYERLIAEYSYTQEKIAKIVGKSRPAVANSLRLLNLSGHIRDMLTRGAISAGHARALLSVESLSRRDAIADEIAERDLSVRQAENLVGRENVGAGAKSGAAGATGVAGVTGGGGGPGVAGDAGGGARGIGGVAGGADGPGGGVGVGSIVTGSPGGGASGGAGGGAASGSWGNVDGGAGSSRVGVAGHGDITASEYEAAVKSIEDELRAHFSTRVSLAATKGKAGKIVIEYYDDEDLQRLLELFGLRGKA